MALVGTVVPGDQRGRTIGFPTANLEVAAGMPVPPRGVYAAFADGRAAAGFFMVVLDTTVVNVALPAIDASLGGGVAGSQWVVDAYTLTFGALVLSAGHVSDRIGASVGFGAGIAGFATSSALCALAPTLGVLVVARAFQGASAAVMLPSSLALVSRA